MTRKRKGGMVKRVSRKPAPTTPDEVFRLASAPTGAVGVSEEHLRMVPKAKTSSPLAPGRPATRPSSERSLTGRIKRAKEEDPDAPHHLRETAATNSAQERAIAAAARAFLARHGGSHEGLFEMLRGSGYDPHHLAMLEGGGFFGDLWSGVKNQFTDPNSVLQSKILPVAQFIPYVGPLAKAARVGAVVGRVASAASKGAQALGRAANTLPGVGKMAVGQAARNAAANTATASRVGSVYDAVSRGSQLANPALSQSGMRQTAAAAAQMRNNLGTMNPALSPAATSMSPFGRYETNATRAAGLSPAAAAYPTNATPGYVPPVGRGHFGCGKNGKERKWLQKVVEDMKKGAFTKQAKRAGMDVEDFADEVLKNPDAHTLTTRRRAQFLVNIRKEGGMFRKKEAKVANVVVKSPFHTALEGHKAIVKARIPAEMLADKEVGEAVYDPKRKVFVVWDPASPHEELEKSVGHLSKGVVGKVVKKEFASKMGGRKRGGRERPPKRAPKATDDVESARFLAALPQTEGGLLPTADELADAGALPAGEPMSGAPSVASDEWDDAAAQADSDAWWAGEHGQAWWNNFDNPTDEKQADSDEEAKGEGRKRGVCLPKKTFVKEHNKLVKVLRKGSKAAREAEAAEQAAELQKRGGGMENPELDDLHIHPSMSQQDFDQAREDAVRLATHIRYVPPTRLLAQLDSYWRMRRGIHTDVRAGVRGLQTYRKALEDFMASH